MKKTLLPSGAAFALSLLFLIALPGCGSSAVPGATQAKPGASNAIKVLSNRADLISGGDALVEVLLPAGAPATSVVMTLNGKDVTSQFALRDNGRYMAQLTGLALGDNSLSARIGGASAGSVSMIIHPIGGPVFGGPQPMPWRCRNIAKAINAQCDQPAEYSYLYKSTDPTVSGLQAYDPASPATDVAMTTTDQGKTVPFIVRRELGYQDRDQYYILTLFDPAQQWKPWAPQPQWNRKLLITHGGSCGVTFTDGTPPLDDYSGTIPSTPVIEQSYIAALGLGFAVASTALDNLGHNCNVVTQAESLVMVKERLVEEYGELRYTLGTGCSGGSITQHQVANAYPGVYQGLIVTCSYPDVFTTAVQFAEYNLLRQYFEAPQKWAIPWVPTQFGDVEGHLSHVNAVAADEAFFKAATNPANPGCNGLPADQLYNASSNPGGVRCSAQDYMINVFGPRDMGVWTATEQGIGKGFGGLPVDNVGVQYGLSALQSGLILPDQFIDLNAKVGGLSIDIVHQPERTVGDAMALLRAYRTGAINTTSNLDQVPIIDGRGPDPGIAHDAVHVLHTRLRLDAVHGHHDNQLIWEGPVPLIGDLMYALNALTAMDRWVAAIEADTGNRPLPVKVVANKPADLGDACYSGVGLKLTDGLCPPGVVPKYSTPRIVAGDSVQAITNKCQLKPLTRDDDYGLLGLTDAQWATMQATFPNGVCDFSKPPVGFGPTLPWLTYQDARGEVIYGGQPLPVAASYSGSGWASPAFSVFSPAP